MKKRKPTASRQWKLASFLLWLFSFMVPARLRQGWLEEWKAELWQAHDAGWSSTGRLYFVVGALPDAFWLLKEWREERVRQSVPASRCLLLLATFAALLTATALSLPQVRAEFRQTSWHTPGELSILFLPNASNEAGPTITPERFLLWKERARYLQAIGFYQVEERNVEVQGRSVQLRIAHGTSNLGAMIGEGAFSEYRSDERTGELILSSRAWRQTFPSEGSIKGKSFSMGGQTVRISSVTDLEDSGLPGSYDAWLFDDKPLQAGKLGFVLGRFVADAETSPYFGFSTSR